MVVQKYFNKITIINLYYNLHVDHHLEKRKNYFTHNIELVMRILVFLLIIMLWNLNISSQGRRVLRDERAHTGSRTQRLFGRDHAELLRLKRELQLALVVTLNVLHEMVGAHKGPRALGAHKLFLAGVGPLVAR